MSGIEPNDGLHFVQHRPAESLVPAKAALYSWSSAPGRCYACSNSVVYMVSMRCMVASLVESAAADACSCAYTSALQRARNFSSANLLVNLACRACSLLMVLRNRAACCSSRPLSRLLGCT
eukprot:TRINITY_DN11978_c0_g2_i8.p1 TRINITY_DN11978_c0_g2~~TRINITY_DN11978_c0_g2_i8.p1  ORF type:complete len:121 (-),score=11.76 TRINITY_DN11978_c0_g2_i8:361-723(-)